MPEHQSAPATGAASESDTPAATASAEKPADPAAMDASTAEADAKEPAAPAGEEAAKAAAKLPAAAASEEAASEDEESADARRASPSPGKDASRDEPALAADESASKEPLVEETAAARVARLWTQHAEKDEKLASADRLTISSAYRSWVKTADLGLSEGTDAPPFTEVWLVLNTKPSKVVSLKAAEDKGDSKRGRDNEEKRSAKDNKRHRSRSRERRRDEKADAPPVSSVNATSARRPRNGEVLAIRAVDSSIDPLADFAAEANSVYKKEGTADGDSDKEGPKAVAICDKGEGGDREADKEAGGSLALERELDRRAAQRATSSRLDEPLTRSRERTSRPDRKDEKQRQRSREPEFSHAKCLEMFDEALKDVCKEGLSRELPCSASLFSDRMRRLFKGWYIGSTPFGRFGELLNEAEREGLVKVEKDKSQLLVTWIKYKYIVRAPTMRSSSRGEKGKGKASRGRESRERQPPRGRSRSRARAGTARAGTARGGRVDGGARSGRGGERGHTRGHGDRVPRADHHRGRDGASKRRAIGGDRGRDRDRGRQADRKSKREREKKPERKKDKKRAKSSEYSYSYDYTDEESYSASPSPSKKRRRSRSKGRR